MHYDTILLYVPIESAKYLENCGNTNICNKQLFWDWHFSGELLLSTTQWSGDAGRCIFFLMGKWYGNMMEMMWKIINGEMMDHELLYLFGKWWKWEKWLLTNEMIWDGIGHSIFRHTHSLTPATQTDVKGHMDPCQEWMAQYRRILSTKINLSMQSFFF